MTCGQDARITDDDAWVFALTPRGIMCLYGKNWYVSLAHTAARLPLGPLREREVSR